MARLSAAATLALLIAGHFAPAQEITVRSEASKAPGSAFLGPPGTESDPYAPKVDWAALPPWKKASFYGVRAQGKTFIYVVDCSGSMSNNDRLVRAKREIRRSVGDLRFPQRFQVIFYNDRPLSMPGGVPQGVDPGTRAQFAQWMNLIDAEGETDPRGAMAQAISMKPDAIFLLSDGEFPEGSAESIARKNAAKVPIHCIDLAGSSEDLRRIAKESGGQYVSRP